MAADPDLIAQFAQGWALTRGVAAPKPYQGGHFIQVGQPDQKARYIFPRLDREVVTELAHTIGEPFVFLKICEAEDDVRALLPQHWSIRQPPTYMMTAALAAAGTDLPLGYSLTLDGRGPIIKAAVLAEGLTVARGRVAMLGDTALFDQISTDEAHRRLGLGRALMQSLTNVALDRGAGNGLLSATQMGRWLYESIGWTVHSPYTSAVIPV
jgi:GNAT superfamily N-acetyltransferase